MGVCSSQYDPWEGRSFKQEKAERVQQAAAEQKRLDEQERAEQEKAGVGMGSSFIALAPASGAPRSPRSSRVSPGGPQRNRGSDPRRRLQRRKLWSDLPLGPQLQLLQQLPADSETFLAIPSDPEWNFRTIPSETF